jgi:hypothetical protein
MQPTRAEHFLASRKPSTQSSASVEPWNSVGVFKVPRVQRFWPLAIINQEKTSMTWKTLALAGTATFALMTTNAAFAQNGATDTAPAATDTTTTDTNTPAPGAKTDMGTTDTTATPAKKHHHKKKTKAAKSESSEEMTTEQLNQQQLQHPGTTPTGATEQHSETMPAPADNGNNANPAAQSDKMGNGDMNNSEMKTDTMKKDVEKKKDEATPTPPASTTPMP